MSIEYKAYYFTKKDGEYREGKATFSSGGINFMSPETTIVIVIPPDGFGKIEYLSKDRLLVELFHFRGEKIELMGPGVTPEFTRLYPQAGKRSFLNRIHLSGYRGLAILLLVLLSLLVLAWFLLIPWVGSLGSKLVSKEEEVAMGKVMFAQLIPTLDVDSQATNLVGRMAARVDFRTTYPLHFVVVNKDEKNAFALPGGSVVIYSRLLDEMKSYPQLMALLSHEVSHINKRHSLQAIFRSLSSSMFLSIVFGDMNGISAVLMENLDRFKDLSYSRSLEQEADEEGLQILFHNGIDPRGMPQLFSILMDSEDEAGVMEFASTHPLSKKRILNAEQHIKGREHISKPDPEMQALWDQLKGSGY